MPTNDADTLAQVLRRMASDYRQTVAFYGNIQGRPGFSRAPRRLLNDTGFLETTDVTYLVPSPSHVETQSDPRAVTTIAFHPYGAREDAQRLTSGAPADRRVRSADALGSGLGGVVAVPSATSYLISADQDAMTTSATRTLNLVRRVTNAAQGPAYHFIVDRAGNLYISAAIDDVVRASASGAETTIDVAVETALAIRRSDWEVRQYANLVELPLTDVQLTTLAVLCAKLLTAFPAIARAFGGGFRYDWPTDVAGTSPSNFQASPPSGVPFDYAQDTPDAFFLRVDTQGTFDLQRDVWRPVQTAPTPVATRAEARTAIATADTLGALSVRLGNYAGVASAERSNEMQSVVRQRLFIQRVDTANADADQSASDAGQVSGSAEALSEQPVSVQNYEPLAYDYATGFWGDGSTY